MHRVSPPMKCTEQHRTGEMGGSGPESSAGARGSTDLPDCTWTRTCSCMWPLSARTRSCGERCCGGGGHASPVQRTQPVDPPCPRYRRRHASPHCGSQLSMRRPGLLCRVAGCIPPRLGRNRLKNVTTPGSGKAAQGSMCSSQEEMPPYKRGKVCVVCVGGGTVAVGRARLTAQAGRGQVRRGDGRRGRRGDQRRRGPARLP